VPGGPSIPQASALGDPCPEDQVLQHHGALRRLVAALDHGDGALPLVGIFQLVAEILRIAEIDLGPDAGAAQLAGHRHVIRHPVAIHHRHDDRPRRIAPGAALGAQRCQQPVDTDGDPRRRHRLPGEALYQIVITPAARDRTELPLAALLVKDLEGQFRLEHRAGVIAQAADDARVDHDAVGAIALRVEKCGDGLQLVHPFGPDGRTADQVAQPRNRACPGCAAGRGEAHHHLGLFGRKPRALGEITAFIPAALTQQRAHANFAQPVDLVDGAQDDAAFPGKAGPIGRVQHARDLHHPVQHLAVVHLHHIIAAEAKALEHIRQHGADFRIRRDRGRADRIGITLIELAEPTGPGLFVAPDRPHCIAAVGRRQVVAILRGNPRQRRGQVIAQRQPAASSSCQAKTPSFGRSTSGRNLPSASTVSTAEVSSGSKP
jgi:hypothetical protein